MFTNIKLIAISALLLICFSCTNSSNKLTKIDDTNTTNENITRVIPNVSDVKSGSTTEKVLINKSKSKSKSEDSNISSSGVNYHYHIIVASFATRKKAKSHQQKLYIQGYGSSVISGNGRYRVAIESMMTKAEALQELDRLKEESNNYGLWILSN